MLALSVMTGAFFRVCSYCIIPTHIYIPKEERAMHTRSATSIAMISAKYIAAKNIRISGKGLKILSIRAARYASDARTEKRIWRIACTMKLRPAARAYGRKG